MITALMYGHGAKVMSAANSKKPWTEEEFNAVLQLDIAGRTQHEIAQSIKRSFNSVRHIMSKDEYKQYKVATLTKLALSKTFNQGSVYMISEMEKLPSVAFLPSKFVYEGKTQGKRPKHIFRSVNGGYILTFTNIQLYGYTFKEVEERAKGIRKDERRAQEKNASERFNSSEGRQRSQAYRRCNVEQETSQESNYQQTT